MLVRMANREDPDQTASSDLGLPCLFRPFWQATSVRNFIMFTVVVSFFLPVSKKSNIFFPRHSNKVI